MKGTSIVQCDKCLKKYAYKSTGNPYPGGKDRETAICPYCGAEGPSEFISGFIYGIYIGSEYYVDEFSFSLAFISWIITLISGMTFLGFAEIIKLLEAIKNK